MPIDMFLKIDGIDGESSDARHKGAIEIEAFSWGATNSGSAAHGGGAGAGKVSVQDFSFAAHTGRASPQLFLACATGQHLKSALLTVRRSGAQQADFLKVTMSDLIVSSWQQSAPAGADVPTDQVTLNFSKVEIAATSQNAGGAAGEAVRSGWDVRANTKA